ncbi:MAG TPA: hypothetical protein VLV54_08460 [Thermoanaerobaculia bacterium]|nr:hypothetical protein [Thermoanaerobaculia bacterium]
MKKHPRRLTLHRETLLRLEDAPLRALAGGGVAIVQETEEPACYSPLCGPTYWKTCETQIG